MKLLFDFFPIILFFVSYYQATFLTENTFIGDLVDPNMQKHVVAVVVATAIAILANFLQVAWNWIKNKRAEKMHLFSFGLFLLLGGITVILGDPFYLKWKPTVLNWLFAAVFFGSFFIGEKTLIERAMGSQLELPEQVWTRLNYAWITFFLVSGAANLYVAFYYGIELDEETRMDNWVNFKLFGLMGLTLLFVILQAIYLARYLQDVDEDHEISEKRKVKSEK